MSRCLKLLDPVVICPYDSNHLISQSRLQKHIVKCEKNFPKHYKVMCPFNGTHRLFESELEEHIVTCPTRNFLESELYSESERHRAITVQSEISSTIDCTENWDLEEDGSRIFTDEESIAVSEGDIDAAKKAFHTEDDATDKESLRGPRGFSEAMLKEENEESCIEDVESVISSMGIGRGKVTQERDRLRIIAIGRGKPLNTD